MEIVCPHCNFSRSVDPAKVPDRPVKVTCPKCAQGFSFDKSTVAGDPPAAPAAPAAPTAAAAIAAEATCPACGLTQPAAESCAGCGIVYEKWQARQQARAEAGELPPAASLAQLHQQAPALTAQALPKAGFWIRVVASFIDGLLIGIVQFVLALLLGLIAGMSGLGDGNGEVALAIVVQLFGMALSFGYYIFFTGYCGQTPGKMAVRIKVIRTDGSEIAYGRAFLREVIGKTISAILLGIGYLMVAFDGQKQGLHDKMADTYVIKL